MRDKASASRTSVTAKRATTQFGAGYAGPTTACSLWTCCATRAARELTSFLGGSHGAADDEPVGDRAVHQADLETRSRKWSRISAPPASSVEDLENYVDGINAYIAGANPTRQLKPGEYALHNTPTHLDADRHDRRCLADQRIFGKGGGNELHSALMHAGAGRTDGAKRAATPGTASARRKHRKRPRRSQSPSPYETEALRQARPGAARPKSVEYAVREWRRGVLGGRRHEPSAAGLPAG